MCFPVSTAAEVILVNLVNIGLKKVLEHITSLERIENRMTTLRIERCLHIIAEYKCLCVY